MLIRICLIVGIAMWALLYLTDMALAVAGAR